ncbi:hypothetical protein Tco_0656770 [Tanacetum coccineum]|uniref:Uncharacterized protein n=1 Tax=Tanacetum coccineum TaxID=301880 RepID=A0ABQ4X9X6_9ASTR
MTGNRHSLENFQEFKGGNVTFGGGEGRITVELLLIGPISLDFEEVSCFDGEKVKFSGLVLVVDHSYWLTTINTGSTTRTASLRPPKLGPPAIIATIDGSPYTITEASIRSNLQLADEGGAAEDQDSAQPSSSRVNEPEIAPFTSTFVANESAGGSFHESPPRSYEATPFVGQPSGVAKDLLTLTALSSFVFKYVQKTKSLEFELKNTKKTLGTAVKVLVERVKKLERKLKRRKKKMVISDSDDDADRMEQEIDMDLLIALENASLAKQQSSFVTPSKDRASRKVAKSLSSADKDIATGSEPTLTSNEDIPTDFTVTSGSMPIPTSSGTILAGMSVPIGSIKIPVNSEQIPPVSTSVNKAEMDRESKELLRQDELLARQLNQDFDMPEQQKKRQQEVHAAVMHYTEDDWITIMAKIQATEELLRTLIGSNLSEGDFSSTMFDEVEATSAAMEDPVEQVPSEDVRASKESEVAKGKVDSSGRTARKRKFVARKGLHISKSSIPVDKGDPDADQKMCLKYASNKEDNSDCDTLVSSYAVVDWELLPTRLRTINIDKKAEGVGHILWGNLRILMDSPEVDDGMGNELTTAVQLVKFLKQQIADSKGANA